MRHFVLLVLALSFLAVESPANAQRRSRRWYRNSGGYGSYGGYGGYGGYSSTPIEGARRGLAELVRASGDAAEATTQAMINYEDARSKYIDNRMKWTKTYWARKRLGEAERRKDYARKQEARLAYLATKGSGYPPRLSPSELDPSTGKVYWPRSLMGDEYIEVRREIDELFLLGIYTGSLRQYSTQIHDKSRSMQDKLKTHIRDMRPNDYIGARKFLESLAFEGRYPVG